MELHPKCSDKVTMRLSKIRVLLVFVLLTCTALSSAFAYRILYAEQFYRLYHVQFYQYPDRIAENIYFLEQALRADFCNPLYALAEIENEKEWERYRYLFTMHVNLKLTELYLRWGSKYNKEKAYFYNAPWKEENLASLEKAEQLFEYSRNYWSEAVKWSVKAWPLPYHLERVQVWEDENYRIETGDLDYGVIITEHIGRLQKVKEDFQKMDENTY
jgi:hypothetical protein